MVLEAKSQHHSGSVSALKNCEIDIAVLGMVQKGILYEGYQVEIPTNHVLKHWGVDSFFCAVWRSYACTHIRLSYCPF
jgi:hypothetical protein